MARLLIEVQVVIMRVVTLSLHIEPARSLVRPEAATMRGPSLGAGIDTRETLIWFYVTVHALVLVAIWSLTIARCDAMLHIYAATGFEPACRIR